VGLKDLIKIILLFRKLAQLENKNEKKLKKLCFKNSS